MSIGAKLIQVTHSKLWINFMLHAPLAAALVLAFPHWWVFVGAASIGVVKDVWLDRKYATPTPPYTDVYTAAGFYVVGATIGAVWAGIV